MHVSLRRREIPRLARAWPSTNLEANCANVGLRRVPPVRRRATRHPRPFAFDKASARGIIGA
jgi:hypothetical protein